MSNQGNHGNSQQHAEAGRKGGENSHSHTAASSKQDHRHQDNLSEEQRSEISRKGGEAVSKDHKHMSEIGKKGGENSHSNK